MHRLLLLTLVLFVVAAAAVTAPEAAREPVTPSTAAESKPPSTSEAGKKPQSQPSGASEGKTRRSPAEILKISDTYLKQCPQDWDVATHMTRKEWQRTCLRLVHNRVKFMAEETGK